jgi:molybdopterin converting factor small subunit
MAVVTLRAPLKDLAGGNSTVKLDGATVVDVMKALERDWPRTTGWVLDETGRVRRHVNVFLNGEPVDDDAAVRPDDRIHVLPAITGGSRI